MLTLVLNTEHHTLTVEKVQKYIDSKIEDVHEFCEENILEDI